MEVDGVPLVAASPGDFSWGEEKEEGEEIGGNDSRSFWEQALESLNALPGVDDGATADCSYLEGLEDLVFHGETGLFLNCDSSCEGMLLGYPQNNAEEQPGHESQILCDAGSMMAHEDDATGQTVVTTSESANRLLDEWLLPGSGIGGCQALEKEEQCLDDCITLVPSLMQKPEIKETNGNEFDDVSERRISADRKRSASRAFETAVESLGEGESGGIESVEVNTKTAGSSSGVEMTDASDHDKGRGAALASSNVRTPTSSPEEDSDPKRQIRLLRNRESASQSRARKKSYVKSLELKCRMMENHVSQLQRAMTASSMENTALRQELVRVTKFKDNSFKSGVAEPAVLESNSLPLEFLPHHSYQCPMGHQYHTGGRCHGWLLALVQLLLLTVVRESNMSQGSPQQLHEAHSSSPFWPVSHSVGFEALTSHRAIVCSAFPNPGHRRKRRIISGLQFFEHFRALNAPVPHVRPLFKQTRYQVKRRIKRLLPGRSGRKALH
jgi:hypothetical protein